MTHVVFAHGLFVTPKSWDDWKANFEQRGFTCHAPANPCHEQPPSKMWKNIPDGLGKVTLRDVVENLAGFIDGLPEKPIVIGHSLGGLATQKIVEMGKAKAGICIDGAAPAGILTTKFSFYKCNLPVLNPFKGNSVFKPTKDWFHYAFCNTMTRAESDSVFDTYVVPESRNIPRGTAGKYSKIDFSKSHAPLLFIAGEKDHIIPSDLNRRNFRAYKDMQSIREFKEFPGRGHYIVGDRHWEEVADFVASWIGKIF